MTSTITTEEASATLKYLYGHGYHIEVDFYHEAPTELPGGEKCRAGFFAVLRRAGGGGVKTLAVSPVLHENDSHEQAADVWYPVKESKNLTDKSVAAAVQSLMGKYKVIMEEENRGRLVGKYEFEAVEELLINHL